MARRPRTSWAGRHDGRRLAAPLLAALLATVTVACGFRPATSDQFHGAAPDRGADAVPPLSNPEPTLPGKFDAALGDRVRIERHGAHDLVGELRAVRDNGTVVLAIGGGSVLTTVRVEDIRRVTAVDPGGGGG